MTPSVGHIQDWHPPRDLQARRLWEAHLRDCALCRQRAEAGQQLEALLANPPPAYPAPPGLALRIQSRLLFASQEETRILRAWTWSFLVGLWLLAMPWLLLTLWVYPRAARAFLLRIVLWQWWLTTLWELVQKGLPSFHLWPLLMAVAWVLAALWTWLGWRWVQRLWSRAWLPR